MKKFDFVVGNPPYQEIRETTKDMPVYDIFMDASFKITEKSLFITPARFLFNAGATSKNWNRKMLDDPHFKVLKYYINSREVFSSQNINGGVVISYRDTSTKNNPIKIFTPFPELNSIIQKLISRDDIIGLDTIMYPYSAYNLSNKFWIEHPELKEQVEYVTKYRNQLTKEEKKGKLSNFRIITTNIFDLIPDLFFNVKPKDDNEYCCIIGRQNNKRTKKYILKRYIDVAENYEFYKILLSASDGASGTIGNPIPARITGIPYIVEPMTGYTQSFQSIGSVSTRDEAESILKYVKSKFARACLGILKITQHYPQIKWKYVPLQDFTENSDIDWTKSIAEIDQQLYKKYGLSDEEIAFIEEKVQEME